MKETLSVRPPPRQFSKFIAALSLVLVAGVMLVVFQNCSGMAAAYNPLYDGSSSIGCVGVSCTEDLSMASATSSAQAVLLDQKSAGASATTCDSSTCFDIGGYCDTGGYPGSVFYYQWLLNGQTPGAETKTAVNCDENGRWRLMMRVPFTTFTWTAGAPHRLRVFMHIIDDGGIEALNPTGRSEMTFGVSARP